MINVSNDQYYKVNGVASLFKEESKGIAKLSRFEFKPDPLFNLHAARDHPMFRIREGEYIKLHVNGRLMMSDTGMERISNKPFINNATGKVLIAGLGIGLIIHNTLPNNSITEITVIEKYQDVIDLVAPKFNDPRLNIICADIHTWEPPKGTKYDTIYFDIWPDICVENLSEIRSLHARFKSRKAPNGWMNSWMKEFLQKQKRKY